MSLALVSPKARQVVPFWPPGIDPVKAEALALLAAAEDAHQRVAA